jgi:hypothetical protein
LLAPGIIGETTLTLWLATGVNVQRWNAQAAAYSLQA